MEFPDDILSVIQAFARPRRPKQREANLIKEHVAETHARVRIHLHTMARHDPFQNNKYIQTSYLVDSWTHYGRSQIAKQPPGWMRRPLTTPSHYLSLYRRSLN
jgi:hypothetical protein